MDVCIGSRGQVAQSSTPVKGADAAVAFGAASCARPGKACPVLPDHPRARAPGARPPTDRHTHPPRGRRALGLELSGDWPVAPAQVVLEVVRAGQALAQPLADLWKRRNGQFTVHIVVFVLSHWLLQ